MSERNQMPEIRIFYAYVKSQVKHTIFRQKIYKPFATSAILYSIAATAQANGIDTEQYLTELFSQPVGTIILQLNT